MSYRQGDEKGLSACSHHLFLRVRVASANTICFREAIDMDPPSVAYLSHRHSSPEHREAERRVLTESTRAGSLESIPRDQLNSLQNAITGLKHETKSQDHKD